MLIAKEQPAEPQFHEVRNDEAVAVHSTLRNIGPTLLPAQVAANFFIGPKSEEALTISRAQADVRAPVAAGC